MSYFFFSEVLRDEVIHGANTPHLHTRVIRAKKEGLVGNMKAASDRDWEGAVTGVEGEREGESCVRCRDEG